MKVVMFVCFLVPETVDPFVLKVQPKRHLIAVLVSNSTTCRFTTCTSR